MIIRVIERVGNVNIQNRIVRVIRVYDRNIPGGITVDTLTEAGSMIVASAASTPSETGAPSADGQAWVSDLAEPLKGRWQPIITSAGGSIELTNKSGSNQVAGTVVILDKSNDSAFTTTTTLNDRRVVGVLEEDIDNNATGQVASKGKSVTVKVQGNVARGDWIIASTTVGRASSYGVVRPTIGAIGIALTAYSGGGAGTVTVLLDVDIYSATLAIDLLGTAGTNGSNSASSLDVTHTLSTASNRIAFACVYVQTQTCSGVTYGGVAMTQLGVATGSNERMYIFYLLEASLPANGSKTVTATLSGAAPVEMSVFTLKNAKQSAPGTAVTNTSASAQTLTVDLTVNILTSFAITAAGQTGGGTYIHGTGQVEISDHTTGWAAAMATSYEECSATGTNTQSSTTNAGANRMVMIGTVVEPG